MTTIVHPPIGDSSSKTSSTSISLKELKAMKKRNHVDALRKLMSNQGITSVEKPLISSIISSSEPSGNSITLLVQKLKSKVFEVDILKTIVKKTLLMYLTSRFCWSNLVDSLVSLSNLVNLRNFKPLGSSVCKTYSDDAKTKFGLWRPTLRPF